MFRPVPLIYHNLPNNVGMTTWRIIPLSKWLGSPPFISHLGHLEGEQHHFEDFLTMVIIVIPDKMATGKRPEYAI